MLDGGSAAFEPLLDEKVRMDAMAALKVLDQVMYAANAVYDMDSVCGYDSLTYMHSVNAALLSTMMGVGMGLGNGKLETLAQAALLHDIGKTKVDPKIIKGAHKLSPGERAEVDRLSERTLFCFLSGGITGGSDTAFPRPPGRPGMSRRYPRSKNQFGRPRSGQRPW